MAMIDFKKTISRKCSVCGKVIKPIIYKDGFIRGAFYYGKMNIPIGKGEHIKTGTFKLGNKKYNVSKWTGKEKQVEYWECESCYNEGNFEYELEETIKKLFGKRCPDYWSECIVCNAWQIFDIVKEENNEKN